MKIHGKKIIDLFKKYGCFVLFVFISSDSYCQQPVSQKHLLKAVTPDDADLFGTRAGYIENIGQYGDKLTGYDHMGKILYGYEGLGMPVLFTSKGLIHLQRQTKIPSHEEIEKEERRKKNRGESEEKWESIDRTISMEWVNANPNPEIITEDESSAYHTYGMLEKKAKVFKKLIYKDLYPGIDVEYSFIPGKKPGFEYSLRVKPGADINVVKMKYGGDVKTIGQNKEGNLIVRSSVEAIIQSAPVGYFDGNSNKEEKIKVSFLFNEKSIIGFKLPAGYDKGRTLVIDPFVSSTGNLTGSSSNAGLAKDIDFDYAGNIYVSGGGDQNIQKLAKFDATGVLQWTFTGVLGSPTWNFGGAYGGWVVEKTTGNIYMGQGLAGSGFSVVRLATTGLYDNYVTTPNSSFGENWKMIYSCHTGGATIMIAGGGGSANNELALLSPPLVVPATSNISGLSGGHNDISDIVIDPLSDDMYTIFSTSINTPGADCRIYKHIPPYSSGNLTWSVLSGYFSLREPVNRPYMQGLDNSSNTLAVNSSYLFYWDGKNLKAIDKATGATVGTPLIIAANTMLTQGGVYADECNNVFVGSANGTIKVYQFNGTTFDDAAAADINITGFPGSAVYDLAYDNDKSFLYASGNGFVASFDVSSYCPAAIYTVSVVSDCASATATVTPAPPSGTTITYALYNGATLLASNTTGVFTGLAPGNNYTVKAFLNQACGGTQASTDFTITAILPVADAGIDTTICFGKNVQLNGSGGFIYSWSPSTYLNNPNIANPIVINPDPGSHIYHLIVTDINGCRSLVDDQVTITVTPPAKVFIGNDTVVAINQPLQLNATDVNNSGFINYLWSPSYGLSNPFIANPVAILDRDISYMLTAGTANNCAGTAIIRIKVYKGPEIYVPGAFTPGTDGLNDILKAIPVGISEFHYFSIYNRWGQLVFTTKDPRKGWDGKIGGVAQSSGVFVWMAEAIDYMGNIIRRKGTCTIIR